jgi:hypothetical protein
MAKLPLHSLLNGASGRLGDMVFRQIRGRTYVQKMPAAAKKPLSSSQIVACGKFVGASQYARQALLDPALKAAFIAAAKEGKSAYNMALADYYKTPAFLNWTRKALLLKTWLRDHFRITSVTATITGSTGEELKVAALTKTKANYWTLKLSWEHLAAGTQIILTALDRAGHRAELTITF